MRLVPHVSLFSDFDLCPEIFSDMQILKLQYLRIRNSKIKLKFSRIGHIYWLWPFNHYQRSFKSLHSLFHPENLLFIFGAKFEIWPIFWRKSGKSPDIGRISKKAKREEPDPPFYYHFQKTVWSYLQNSLR